MENHLFVYGTLLHSIESKMAQFLRANARFLGEAYLPGYLFDLGRYPGVTYAPDQKQRVFGHVYQLYEPQSSLPVLDRYEGIQSPPSAADEYQRRLCEVQMEENKLNAWVYLFQQKTVHLKRIASGNYLTYLSEEDRHDHQSFIQSV